MRLNITFVSTLPVLLWSPKRYVSLHDFQIILPTHSLTALDNDDTISDSIITPQTIQHNSDNCAIRFLSRNDEL